MLFPKDRKKDHSDSSTSGNRWLRDISETKLRTRTTRPDGVVLATLFQATRGILLFAFNLGLFIQFERMQNIPGVDVMAVLPPSIFFLIGFLDLLMLRRVWGGDLNGWRYGIVMSTLITFLTPSTFLVLIFVTSYLAGLYLVIVLFAAAEVIALLNLDARRFYGAKSFL